MRALFIESLRVWRDQLNFSIKSVFYEGSYILGPQRFQEIPLANAKGLMNIVFLSLHFKLYIIHTTSM